MQRVRWPRNFSVFSGSDSDSDGQSIHRRPNAANLRIDTAKASPASSSYPSPISPAPNPILGVYLFCTGDQVDLSSLQTPITPSTHSRIPGMALATVQQNDAIFTSTPLAISNLIGIPLLMRRLLAKPSKSSSHFDNPLAAQLQLDPGSVTADQGARAHGIGTVLVTRADKQPLQKDLLERICAFHAQLLSIAQQQRGVAISDVVKTWATPEKFAAFCAESSKSMGMSVHEMLGGSWLDVKRSVAI